MMLKSIETMKTISPRHALYLVFVMLDNVEVFYLGS